MSRVRLMGSEEDYRKMVEAGLAQFHDLGKGFAITKIVNYANPAEQVVNVLLLAGESFAGLPEVADAAMVSFARANGCNAVEFMCRLGLAVKMKQLGYRADYAVMRKELR